MPNFRRLRDDLDFQELFLAGPLAEEVARLRRSLESTAVTDPVEIMRDKATLAGILLVQKVVEVHAEDGQKVASAPTKEKRPWRAWATTFLPQGIR